MSDTQQRHIAAACFATALVLCFSAPSNAAAQPKEWTISTFAACSEVLRQADEKLQEERDRRYTEVNIEKEKALKIKETADLTALGLAREIQTYKDLQANQLREQINSERGLYVTRQEFKPVMEFISGQQARAGLADPLIGLLYAIGGGVITFLILHALKK